MAGAVRAVALLLSLSVLTFLVVFLAQSLPERTEPLQPTPSIATRMSMVPENPAELEAYVATRPPCRQDSDEDIVHVTGKDKLRRTVGLGFGCWMGWRTLKYSTIVHFEWWTEPDHHFCVQIDGLPGIIKCDPTRDWSPRVGALRFRIIGDDAIRFEVWDNQ